MGPLYSYDAVKIVVPSAGVRQPLKLKAVRDSASGVTAISDQLLQWMRKDSETVPVPRLQSAGSLTIMGGGNEIVAW